ncbi:MAG: hypothetical protein K6G28_03995 [Acholeplasmatales bacterium]|nr:hypothetical protein [Acholeplasmatales bacterium]
MTRKNIIGIVLNSLMIIFEIIAAAHFIYNNGFYDFRFYTLCSNALGGVVSLLWLIQILFKVENKKFKDIVKYFSYTAAICLTVTFIIVLIVLVPMAAGKIGFWSSFKHYVLESPNLFQHLICPILFVVTFMYNYEFTYSKNHKDNLIACIATLVYAVIVLILCIARAVEPPYPFYDVYNQPWYMSVFWAIVVLGITYLISMLVKFVKAKVTK